MSDILTELKGVVGMMDDVLVHERTTKEHNERLDRVLQKLEEAGLTLNRQKCHFSKPQVKFLCQIVDKEGVCPDPDKV